MITSARQTRRTDAQRLTNQLLATLNEKSFTHYGVSGNEAKLAFMTGYINSLLSQVAAASPASLKELASSVAFLQAQK